MHHLIQGSAGANKRSGNALQLNFVRVPKKEELHTKQREVPKKPPPPDTPPPPPDLQVSKQEQAPQQRLDINMPKMDIPFGVGSGPYLGGYQAGGGQEGDVIPIVRIEPNYPREALLNGTEGYVTVNFTINKDGSVSSPHVVKSEPGNVFDRAALRAILRWKFKPRIVDGKPVEREATQTITFKLPKGAGR
jgi:protein TonB